MERTTMYDFNLQLTGLQMLTQEDVAELLHVHVMSVTMLREVGVLPAIKCSKCFMFSQSTIKKFQEDYVGLDVSNRVKALESFRVVNSRKG